MYPERCAEVNQCNVRLWQCLFFVIDHLCSSLLPSTGLPHYGVPDGSCFIKQRNNFIEFLTHVYAQVLTFMSKQPEFSRFLGILNAGDGFFSGRVGKTPLHLPCTAVYVLLQICTGEEQGALSFRLSDAKLS